MFDKLSELKLPKNLENEFYGYLSMINDHSISCQIEDVMVAKYKTTSTNDNEGTIRLSCLHAMFHYMGLKSRGGYANNCSVRFCECVIKTFSSNGCEKFELPDRLVLYRIEAMDDCMLRCLLDFNRSPYFDETVLVSVLNPKIYNNLPRQVYLLSEIYPDADKEKIIKYILYYKKPLAHFGRKSDSLAESVKKLLDLDIDFFVFSDVMHSYGEKLDNCLLSLYVYKLNRLNVEYGIDWRELFSSRIPGFIELDDVMLALSNGVSTESFGCNGDLEFYHERILWLCNGLSIDVFIADGSWEIDALRLMRYIYQANCDPADFGFKPEMTPVEIHNAMEAWRGSLTTRLSSKFTPMICKQPNELYYGR